MSDRSSNLKMMGFALFLFGLAAGLPLGNFFPLSTNQSQHNPNTLQEHNLSEGQGGVQTKAFSRGVINPIANNYAYVYSGIPLQVIWIELMDDGTRVALVALPDGTEFMTDNKEVVKMERGTFFRFKAQYDPPRMHKDPFVEELKPYEINFDKVYYTDPFGGQQ